MSEERSSLPWLALLAATIAVGAFLRFDRLGEPSYWLDEILHQHLTDLAATKSWWHWLGRLQEENGGLYYLTQLATRLFGRSELAGRSAAALFGLATIPVVWLLPLERRARCAAALLLAVSPLHVYYSREARGYALLLFLTALLILVLLRGRSLVVACFVVLALVYTSAVASPVVASAAGLSFLIALFDRARRRWYLTFGGCSVAALALFRVVYGARPASDPQLPGFPALDWHFLASLARMFSVSGLGTPIGGRAALAMLAFALVGAVVLARTDRNQAIPIIGMTVLPLAISFAALRFYDHFFAVRYVLVSLIGYVVLTGIGIGATARLIPRPAKTAGTLVIAVLIAAQGWHSARTEAFQKLDWRGVAATLRRHARSGDLILAAEPWSEVSLRYYLGDGANVGLVHAAGVGIAEILVRRSPATWLVTAGSSGDASVRNWMCRYPLLLASPLEGFRLHYAPSAGHFLAQRSNAPEQRAFSAALGGQGFVLHLGSEDDVILEEGWAGFEGGRWVIGRRATLAFPRDEPRDRVIRFRAYPLSHPTLAPQTLRLSLNGVVAGDLTLLSEWRDYRVSTPASLWVDGMNRVTLEFSRATAPSSLVPSSGDARELAANFEWIAIDDAGITSNVESTTPRGATIRAGAEVLLDAHTVWRGAPTRFPSIRLRGEFVRPLLGRLGFDPRVVWVQLARDEVHLDDVVETMAYGGDCESHETFVRRAFAILLQRPPSEHELQDLLGRLAVNPSRVVIAGRIAKSDEFRAKAMKP